MHNGAWLIFRDMLNIAVRSCGSFIIMALITPVIYGKFSFLIGSSLLLTAMGQMGINVLILKTTDISEQEYECINTVSFYSALSFSLLFLIIIGLFNPNLFLVSLITSVSIFFGIIKIPFLGKLEKATKFKEISKIDINSQVLFYALVIPMCFLKPSVLVLLIGQVCTICYSSIHTIAISNHDFRMKFSIGPIRRFKSFCLNFTVSAIFNQAKLLLNIFLPHIMGFDVSGKIALTSRFNDTFNVFGDASRRLTLSGIVKKTEKEKVYFICNGLQYLMIFLGIFLSVSYAFLPYIIRNFLKNWTPIIDLIPMVFISIMFSSMLPVLFSILYNFNKDKNVTIFSFIQNFIIIVGSLVLIPLIDIKGFAYSLLVSSLVPLILYVYVKNRLLKLNYKPLIISFIYALIILAAIKNPYFLILSIIPIFSVKRSEFFRLLKTVRG